MTGYANAPVGGEAATGWQWEIRSVNGRGLDIRCRLPAGLDRLETPARAAVSKRLSRGNVSLALAPPQREGASGLRLNRAALDSVLAIVRELQGITDAAAPRLDGLLGLRGVLEAGDEITPPDDKLEEIEGLTTQAAGCAGAQPAAIKARLEAQIKELLGGSPAPPADRLAQEAAMLAVRADIREEIDRLKAHSQAARALLREGGAIGRKLDFLSQEFNREANTLCSKATDITLTNIGLALKTAIDRLREQAANIE
jgi:uncharacterized protein YicC (UPF0701 family)